MNNSSTKSPASISDSPVENGGLALHALQGSYVKG